MCFVKTNLGDHIAGIAPDKQRSLARAHNRSHALWCKVHIHDRVVLRFGSHLQLTTMSRWAIWSYWKRTLQKGTILDGGRWQNGRAEIRMRFFEGERAQRWWGYNTSDANTIGGSEWPALTREALDELSKTHYTTPLMTFAQSKVSILLW